MISKQLPHLCNMVTIKRKLPVYDLGLVSTVTAVSDVYAV